MKFKNLKISTQLELVFATLLLFVIALGIVSYRQTERMHSYTEVLFQNPMEVRRAIGEMQADAYMVHWGLEVAFGKDDYQDMMPFVDVINQHGARLQSNLAVLYARYLGPKSDIDALSTIINACQNNRNRVISLIKAGNYELAAKINIHDNTVIGGNHLKEINEAIQVISSFSKNKAQELSTLSQQTKRKLNLQLFGVVISMILFSLIINYILLSNIRKPLQALTTAAKDFRAGNYAARSQYTSKNEFGSLSTTFNELAAGIQSNIVMNRMISDISTRMLNENDPRVFFRETLSLIAGLTNSQIAAVYLPDEVNKYLTHYESIGMNGNAKDAFDISHNEGEFGLANTSQKIHHIKHLPENTTFRFHTANGKYTPREMFTIPIKSGDRMIAMITIASIYQYDDTAINFLNNIHNILEARIDGVLINRKIKEFSKLLKQQNQELEAQKSELSAQTYELTRQNTELEIQKKQLNEANILKTSFLSNMSHELRTPLNSVIALSGVLNRRLQGQIPEEEYSYLDVIERNGKHLLTLINDILDLSRIEAGQEKLDVVSFNINSKIAEIIDLINPQATQKNISLLHIDKEGEILIMSDPTKCMHILQNLIGNAVKFTTDGKVEVVAKLISNSLIIKVVDTGIGIDSAHIGYIFDEFRQADGSTSRRFGGTGLGLAIAKKYALLLGGDIFVNSIPGEGSVFTLVLPVAQTTEGMANSNKRVLQSDHNTANESDFVNILQGKTILIVEDSESAVIQIHDILKETGCRIFAANNGKLALEFVAQTIPDAIILDLMMPEVDGFQVLASLRRHPTTAKVPVLILTAKHISKEELSFLKGNNIHQLIQKGDINRAALLQEVISMISSLDSGHIEVQATDTEQDTKSAISAPKIVGKPLVLLVEDNPDNMITAKALLADNFDVIEAINGLQSVEMAKKHSPNLILMDIALPDMDGIEAFKAIRQDTRLQHTHIVALTASAMTSDSEVILAHGFDAYISKPIDVREFYKTINEILYGA